MGDNFGKREHEVFCYSCGSIIIKEAEICPKCGVRQKGAGGSSDVSTKWITALLLCIFVGSFGAHRFFVGKIGTGVLMLITLGGCGIWTIIDLIMILTGSFTDADGNPVSVN